MLTTKNDLDFLDDYPRIKALFLLLLRGDHYITSEELAKKLSVTSRTIKKDIQFLRETLADSTIDIISKQSKGYRFRFSDESVEKRIKEHYQVQRTERVETDIDRHVQYILRRLLSAHEPVTMTKLQDELAMNQSNSLTRELDTVRLFLNDYGLRLETKPRVGMFISGAGFKKVMLSIRLYKFFDRVTNPVFDIDEYDKLFQIDQGEKELIRQVFYRTIIKSRIVFSDINAERFIMYLVYLRNMTASEKESFALPAIDLDYKKTEEYSIVVEIIEKLRVQLEGFSFGEIMIQFLTYIALISTDLYRFRDVNEENYDSLVEAAEVERNFLLKGMAERLNINTIDDYTTLKDLLKFMIPVAMKVKMSVSDSVDIGYENIMSYEESPLLYLCLMRTCEDFKEVFQYNFSEKEIQLLFNIFTGMINRIELEHRKLRLAIIAIEGRLSTQQLKFNLQRYFSDYIEKIETRVLYELDFSNDKEYDYYLCSSYGKNMNIPYRPIYYADDSLSETEYVDTLREIFYESYNYRQFFPEPTFVKERGIVTFQNGVEDVVVLHEKTKIKFHFDLHEKEESIRIYENFDVSGNDEMPSDLYIDIQIDVGGNRQKLRMILNFVNGISKNPSKLLAIFNHKTAGYDELFV